MNKKLFTLVIMVLLVGMPGVVGENVVTGKNIGCFYFNADRGYG